MVSFSIGAVVVTLLQFLRLKDRRLLPLLALFVFQALAHAQSDWYVARYFHLASGLSGLVLLYVLAPHHRGGH